MEIPWEYIHRNFDWFGHILESFCIAAIVSLLFVAFSPRKLALIIGLAFAAGHFHGREKRDFEIAAHLSPPHLDGYMMWRWNWDQVTDFWPTAMVLACAIVLLLARIRAD